MPTWDPERYLAFADERGRFFVELIARIGATAPRVVVDLGCGPGNLTRLLGERWPSAEVIGIDSSAAMIDRARAIEGSSGGSGTFAPGRSRWRTRPSTCLPT